MIKVSYPAGDNKGYLKILTPMLNQLHSKWMLQGAVGSRWPGYDILMLEQFGYVFDETTATFTFEHDADYTAFQPTSRMRSMTGQDGQVLHKTGHR